MESQQFQGRLFEQKTPNYDFNDIDGYFSLSDLKEDQKFDPLKQTKPAQDLKQQKMISWAKILQPPDNNEKLESDSQGQQTDSQQMHNQGLFKTKSCRQKMFIEVGQKTKEKYVNSVKGTKQETSDLTINYKTITKSLLRQQFLFNDFNKNEEDVIRNFQIAKANFKSFQQLFGLQQYFKQDQPMIDQKCQNDDLDNSFFQRNERRTQTEIPIPSKRIIQQTSNKKRKSRKYFTQSITQKYIVSRKCDRIRKLCLRNFSSFKIISQTLKSAKMSSHSKIVTLKFLEQLRDGVISPQNFQSWKRKIKTKTHKKVKIVSQLQPQQIQASAQFRLNEQ